MAGGIHRHGRTEYSLGRSSKAVFASRLSSLLDAQCLLRFFEVALLAWLDAWMPGCGERGSLHALEAVSAGAWLGASLCSLSAYLRAGTRRCVPLDRRLPFGGLASRIDFRFTGTVGRRARINNLPPPHSQLVWRQTLDETDRLSRNHTCWAPCGRYPSRYSNRRASDGHA